MNLLFKRKLFKLIQLSFKNTALDSFVFLVLVVFLLLLLWKRKVEPRGMRLDL